MKADILIKDNQTVALLSKTMSDARLAAGCDVASWAFGVLSDQVR
jgi:hypothetical protein